MGTTTCGFLLSELQKIWDEVGEADDERDKILYELEQECLDAYRKKVDQANHCRAQLRQTVADAEAQLADICAALGDRPTHIQKTSGSLKKQLQAIMPLVEDMKKKTNERKSQFAEVVKQINSISKELAGSSQGNLDTMAIDESDLTMKRLDDLQNQLLLLQKKKAEHLKQVLDQLNEVKGLCVVLGMDFNLTVHDVHPTLVDSSGTKSIRADTIGRLSATISRLKNVKLQRLQRLQDLAMTMVELWNLMDTPVEEQQMFQDVTRTIAATEDEVKGPNSLSLEFINNAEAEVMRLQEIKVTKIKEVLLKKRLLLEEICGGAHMVLEGQLGRDLSVESIVSGQSSPSYLLEQLETQISKVKEEAFSRKEILEKVQKWLAACEEESWLEEYNRDDNRYNAGKGTHLMLKRAEKARVLVNKIPGMVEALRSKVRAWEMERDVEFLYDGVGLTSMIDEYCELKHLKEQERQRQREQKKLQGQLTAEQEAIYGAKPTPSKSGNRNIRPSIGGATNSRFSLGGAMLQNALSDNKSALSSRSLLRNNPVRRQTSSSQHHSGIMAHSSAKKNTSNIGSSIQRKALSPLSSLSSNIVSCNLQDHNAKNVEFRDSQTVKTPTPSATPFETLSAYDENRTPKKMPIPMPATPPTVCTAMQTATTPFTPGIRRNEEVEYSYEEKRAGFVISMSHSKSLQLV